ncbi:Rv3235 family protein [Mycobacterium sp. NPDC051804]|uniref:Rv3235 family protein n=1 Tax=Mycobacterium sp. NPDC051804 TaxID=3364295 RepID=UPI0037A694E0
MPTSPTPAPGARLVSPVIDYEPRPVGMAVCRSTPVLHRRAARPSSPPGYRTVQEADPPRTAVTFADAALRRVLEVIDRRRPVAQLRPLVAPALIDTVIELSRSSHVRAGRPSSVRTVARLRRIRLRMVDGTDGTEAEVFGTYTSGARVRALAARIELYRERWRIVALQIG